MHLFEFGDQNFVPDFYHEFLRDFMGQLYKKLGHYKLWTDSFSKFCERNRSGIIHDPCAGSGEINELLIRELPNFQDYKFLLSDLMADQTPEYHEYFKQIHEIDIEYAKKSKNLLTGVAKPNMPKIFINSFHHFKKAQAKVILTKNLEIGNEILILEYCHKTLMSYISMMAGPIMSLIMFPLVVTKKTFLPCFIFCYLIPIIPLMLLWDGFVSCLRTFDTKDIKKILKEINLKNCQIKEEKRYSFLFPSGVTSISISKNQESANCLCK